MPGDVGAVEANIANIGTFGPLFAAIGAKEAGCSAPGVRMFAETK